MSLCLESCTSSVASGLYIPKLKIHSTIKNFMNAMVLFINHFNETLPVSETQPNQHSNFTRNDDT